ncbi:hypothetical protein BGZ70_001965 [Mortierella alpina]|uniref:Uncharacterized protein n=1 Tax=Mortierella alpina TaxID=64518 RepID=A0A9P6M5P3_MORAP|nr:hypothetical protein BGZ70_001965 [Mortierella alpina]
MAALVTPSSTTPFRNTITSISSSSTSSSSPRRNTGRTIKLLLSLAVACCLLASSTSTLVAATPIPKIAHNQRQQRSLLQQVHHVQIADESVHNSMVLMKKSIQKRKQQQKRSQQQQQQASTHKQKLQKRAPSVEAPSTTLAATVDSLPADDLASSSTSGSETVKRSNGSKAHEITRREERSSSSSSSSSKGNLSSSTTHSSQALSHKRTKNPKSQGHSKASRAKLISAYEAIVFSESQLPVFWNHDHPSRPQQKVTKKLQQQRPKAANLESEASEAKSSTNKGQDHKKSKAPVASDDGDSSLTPKVPVRSKEGAGEGQGVAFHPKSDKNRRATVEVVPVSVTADAQEQLRTDEPREHLLPQQAKRAAALARDGSSQPYQSHRHRRRQYAPEGVASFLEQGCHPSSAMMISGALVVLLLVSYKIYKRTQRQRQMAGLMTPSQLDIPSLKAPLSTSAL